MYAAAFSDLPRLVRGGHLPCHCHHFSRVLLVHAQAVSHGRPCRLLALACGTCVLGFASALTHTVQYSFLSSPLADYHGCQQAAPIRLCCCASRTGVPGRAESVVRLYCRRHLRQMDSGKRMCVTPATLTDSTACATTSCSSSTVAGLIVYSTFSFYWTSQVVSNIVLCTLAGGIYGGKCSNLRLQSLGCVPRKCSSNTQVGTTTVTARATDKDFQRMPPALHSCARRPSRWDLSRSARSLSPFLRCSRPSSRRSRTPRPSKETVSRIGVTDQ